MIPPYFVPILTLLSLTILFLLTPYSLPVWHRLPELAFLQFPWRLLALQAPICAFAIALALNRLMFRPMALSSLSLLLAAILMVPAFHFFNQPCDVEDTPQARFSLFHSPVGTEPTDEYTPVDADPEALHPEAPPYWLLASTADPNTPAPRNVEPGPSPRTLTLTLAQPTLLVLNLRQYPLWQVSVNGRVVVPHSPERADGLLSVLLPAGRDTLALRWRRPLNQRLGLLLSIVALLITCFSSSGFGRRQTAERLRSR